MSDETPTPPAATRPAAHSHDHAHGHSHAPDGASLAGDARARRALAVALAVGLAIMVTEVVAGLAFDSLALLGDAAHMLTDVAAYAIALWAARAAMRPASSRRTFGHGRIEILAALANGATLLAASGWIVLESVRRLTDPPNVDGAGMSVVAALGLASGGRVSPVALSSRTLNALGRRPGEGPEVSP